MALVSLFKGKGPSGFGYGSTASQVTEGLDLSDKTFLLTGATSGLGREAVRVLCVRGATVLATARTRDKAAALSREMGQNVVPYACELSNPTSVRACVEAVKRDVLGVDGIICNAGVMGLPKLVQACGYELQFFTNHIGHYILTTGLLDHLSEAGRIVMLSSAAHNMAPKSGIEFDNLSGEAGYSPWQAYGQSKLANLLHAKALSKRRPHESQTVNAVHPGVILTNIQRWMAPTPRLGLSAISGIFLKSVPQGAATTLFVATHPHAGKFTGEYFADCNVTSPSALARDEALAERLFEVSRQIVEKV